jgi:hypothetical protein
VIPITGYRQRYTCGTHVSGRGRQITSRLGKAITPGKDREIEKGVIITMPGKLGDPYTVLDEQSFIVLEAVEEQLRQLS